MEKTITNAIISNETIEEKKEAIEDVLKNHHLEREDWSKYSFFVENSYTRNAVIHNDLFTVLVLCWSKGCKSQIHDHPCDGCFIVGIDGKLEETQFQKTKENELIPTITNKISKGDISWMHDTIGFHQVANGSETENATTIHIYHPPFNVCKAFKQNGESWNCAPTFYSINGEIVEKSEFPLTCQ